MPGYQVMQVMPWIGPTVSLFGAVLAGFFALLAWLLNRRAQRAQAHEQINQRYDRLMKVGMISSAGLAAQLGSLGLRRRVGREANP